MKVICIDASKGRIYGNIPPFKEGEVVNVRECENAGYYDLIPSQQTADKTGFVFWNKKRFIPLSTIDETELLQQRIKELV